MPEENDHALERMRLTSVPFWGIQAAAVAGVIWLGFSWSGLVWGFVVSTVLLYHGVFTVNSLCHLFGRRRYDTRDGSRNNAFVALITLGEGWHNNHHHYQSSANSGFFWWEVDSTFTLLRVMAWLGLVWDLRTPPPRSLEAPYNRPGGHAPRKPRPAEGGPEE